MPTLVIKNLPEVLHARLKAQAERNHRSMTREAQAILEAGVGAKAIVFDLPPPLKLKGGPLTIEEIDAAIVEGRE